MQKDNLKLQEYINSIDIPNEDQDKKKIVLIYE